MLEEMDAEFGIGALVEEEFDKKEVIALVVTQFMKLLYNIGILAYRSRIVA